MKRAGVGLKGGIGHIACAAIKMGKVALVLLQKS